MFIIAFTYKKINLKILNVMINAIYYKVKELNSLSLIKFI